LRLTDELRGDIQDASRGGQLWIDRSRNGRLLVTTQGDIAFRHPEVELINVSHPLLRAAVTGVGKQLKDAVSRVGQAVITLAPDEDPELPEGNCFIIVFTHEVEGLRARRILETIAWSDVEKDLLDAEESERLMHLVVQRRQEWDRPDDARAMPILGGGLSVERSSGVLAGSGRRWCRSPKVAGRVDARSSRSADDWHLPAD
jgi:hypothetical protein